MAVPPLRPPLQYSSISAFISGIYTDPVHGIAPHPNPTLAQQQLLAALVVCCDDGDCCLSVEYLEANSVDTESLILQHHARRTGIVSYDTRRSLARPGGNGTTSSAVVLGGIAFALFTSGPA